MMVLFTGQKGALRQCFPMQDIMCQMTVVLYIIYLYVQTQPTFLPLKTPPPHQAWHFGNVPVMSLEIFLQVFFLPS